MKDLEFSIRLLTFIVAGLMIGFERQWTHKSAGLRTNTLVSLGAATFVLLSIMLTKRSQVDVTRIIGQVVTGVGFYALESFSKEELTFMV